MATGVGGFSHVGWVPEGAWGTPLVVTKFFRPNKFSGGIANKEGFSDALTGLSKRNAFTEKKMVQAAMEMNLNFEGLEQLLRHLFQTVSPTTGPTAVTVFTHLFEMQKALLQGLSIEFAKDIQATQLNGCKIASATFTFDFGSPGVLSLDVVGKSETGNAAQTATFPAFKPMNFDGVVVKLDGTAIPARSVEVTIDNNLFSDSQELGDLFIKEPTRGGPIEVKVSLASDFVDNSLQIKLSTQTPVKLNIIATGGTITGSNPATNESMDIELPVCRVIGKPIDVGGEGILSNEMEFEAVYDTANAKEPVKITLINGVATI